MHAATIRGRQGETSSGAMGCLLLFGAPFLLGGLVSIWAGYREWASGDPQENWWAGLLVGALFVLVGGGIMAGAWIGRRKLLEREQLERQHPDQPWMWRPDWAQGRVDSDARATMLLAWAMAGFWNVISWVSVIAAWDEVSELGPEAFLLALFPLTGLGLLAWAATETQRHRKFGVSRLELSTLPGVIGGRLAGRIDTRLPEPPGGGVLLSLDSIRMVRSGKNNREKLLWKTEKSVPAARLSRGWQGVSIPVEFQIPADAQETVPEGDRVFWRLSAHADVAGVDFKARFEAPVFRTADSGKAGGETAELEKTWTFASDREEGFDPRQATFVERASPLGGVEYYFPPRSQRRGAFGMTVFLLIWLGALAAMIHYDISLFFQIVWGLFACLIALGALDAWFGSSTVRIESDRIEASHSTIGRGRMRSIGFDEIAAIKTDIGSTQGESMTQSSKAWWNVKAARKADKRDFLIAQNLRSQREAEWLAAEIRRRAAGS